MAAHTAARPGRNEPCHCGSGRKYKHCCLEQDEHAAAAARAKAAAEAAAPSAETAPAPSTRAQRPQTHQPWKATTSRGFVPRTRTPRKVGITAILLAFALTTAPLAQEHRHPSGDKLGTVHFQTSCSPPAQTAFDRAMALLHSFEFGPAMDGFNDALTIDQGCAMAHWGIAIARWSNPFSPSIRPPAQLKLGLDAITRARQAGAKTARERAYIDAAAALYVDADTKDQRARVVAYEQSMSALASTYPDDREASIFWALSLTASALPTDKTYANQLRAGAILERLYSGQPDHPGITHYIIHSYDVPALADRAIDAAHRYATIAPAAPHALHMPAHTFTRVGAWQESIDTNAKSAAAADRIGSRAEQLHAMDYMAYAYLQTGRDAAVETLLGDLPRIARVFDPNAVAGAAPGSAGVFALAAIPARFALERRDWTAAARLVVTPSTVPYADAITHFARALGASQTGAPDDARRSVVALAALRDRLTQEKETYWAEQVAIQHDGAAAFLAMAEGRKAEALALMRATAVREDATEKAAVTPGPIAPARELLGEMLLEMKEPARALKEFQATLEKEPNRFRALYGAARAASLAGDRATARRYYEELLTITVKADSPGRPELVEARRVIAGG